MVDQLQDTLEDLENYKESDNDSGHIDTKLENLNIDQDLIINEDDLDDCGIITGGAFQGPDDDFPQIDDLEGLESSGDDADLANVLDEIDQDAM